MPLLSDLTIAQRKSTILEITRRLQLNPEEKLSNLCEIMGISERQYYYWIREDPEMVEMFRQMISDFSREELTVILSVRSMVLSKLIADALGGLTTGGERLQIMRYLDERSERLADKHRATGDTSAREFLNGPNLMSANSRFSSSTVNIKPQPDGSVDVRVTKDRDTEVVDAIFKEITQANQPETIEESPVRQLPQRLEEVDLNSPTLGRSDPQKKPGSKPKRSRTPASQPG